MTVSEAQRYAGLDVDDTQNTYLRPVALVSTPASKAKNKSVSRKGEPSEAGQKFIDTMNKIRDRIESEWITEQVNRFEELGKTVSSKWSELNTKSLADEVLAEKVIDDIDWEAVKKSALAYETLYLNIAKETFEQGKNVLGLAVNLTDEREANVLAKAGTRKGLVDLKGQTKAAMFDAIKEVREAGGGVDDIARKIRDKVPGGRWNSARTRAQVIARTEGRFAQNISTHEMGKEAGATMYRVVDAQIPMDDGRPHGDEAGIVCSDINGQIVSESDIEYLASVEHPNGTRDFIPVFDPDLEPSDVSNFRE